MKKFIIISSILILSACASKAPLEMNMLPLMKVVEPQTVHEINPLDFEMSMPSSEIIRQSLIIYDKTYSRVYSDNMVLNIAAGKTFVSVLKESEVGFTLPICPSIALTGFFDSVSITGNVALISGRSGVQLFSSEECAIFAKYNQIIQGSRSVYISPYIIEWKSSTVAVRNAFTGAVLFNGDVGGAIASTGAIGGKPVAVLKNGYIMVFNEQMKAFTLDRVFPVNFSELFYEDGVFYGKLTAGEFFTINDASSNLTSNTGCSLSDSSPYALCGDVLVGAGIAYAGVPKHAQNFAVGAGLYMVLDSGNLNIYSLKNVWQRFVSFDYPLPDPCVSPDGSVYFNSFSGDTVKISKGEETIISDRPQKCDMDKVDAERGQFICSGVICGNYAMEIMADDKSSMLRRIENGKRYYFFEKIK